MSKLFVAGCSVSDYTSVNKVYGEYLSEKLEYDYVHEAAACGSNWRIWRKIGNHIINGTLTSKDLLIVQYTTIERKEFWSQIESGYYDKKYSYRDKYIPNNGYLPEGDIIRFKFSSYDGQSNSKEKKFLKMCENFINPVYEREIFDIQHLMFQSLLKDNNIKTIFLGYYLNKDVDFTLTSYFENSYVSVNEIKNMNEYTIDNGGHFSELGHLYTSNKLYDFIMNGK